MSGVKRNPLSVREYLTEIDEELSRAHKAGASDDYLRGLRTAKTMLLMRRIKAKGDDNNDGS